MQDPQSDIPDSQEMTLCRDACKLWAALEPGIRNATAAAGFPMIVKMENATVHTWLAGRGEAIVTAEPDTARPDEQQRTSDGPAARDSHVLASGAIAAIVASLAAAAAAAASLGLWLTRRRWRWLARTRMLEAQDTRDDPTTGSDSRCTPCMPIVACSLLLHVENVADTAAGSLCGD